MLGLDTPFWKRQLEGLVCGADGPVTCQGLMMPVGTVKTGENAEI